LVSAHVDEFSQSHDCVFYINSEQPVSGPVFAKIREAGRIFEAIEDGKIRIGKNFEGRVSVVRHHIATRVYSKSFESGQIRVEIAQVKETSDLDFSGPSHLELDLHFSSPEYRTSFIQQFWQEGLAFWKFLKKNSV